MSDAGFQPFPLNDLNSPRVVLFFEVGGGSAATAIYAPSRASPGGELPPAVRERPALYLHLRRLLSRRSAAGIAPPEGLRSNSSGPPAAQAMRRLNSQYRSIVNSVRERGRACVRDARKKALFGKREKWPGRFWKPRPASVFGADLSAAKHPSPWGPQPPYPRRGRTTLRSKV